MPAPRSNDFGQSIGPDLPGWTPPPTPPREAIAGRLCRLEPMSDRFVDALFAAVSLDANSRHWTYLPYGPFPFTDAFGDWVRTACGSDDPLFFAIVNPVDSTPVGVAAYLRITPAGGSIEVGHLFFSQRLRRTPAATEAMYLMMKRAFELGYRRYEWKCDALNAPSRAAAERLGFSFEGIFRQATVYKGRSRDTAWFSIIDTEWPALAQAFEAWLDPANFDDGGKQRRSLRELQRTFR